MAFRFIDKAKIYVKAGDGGAGGVSFCKCSRKRHFRPDGGDGGAGGNVIIETDENIQTLSQVLFKRHFRAKGGLPGGGGVRSGQNGEDCIIRVPLGTVVIESQAFRNPESLDGIASLQGEELSQPLRYDLEISGERVVVARGGRPGRGNRSGSLSQVGHPGQSKELTLELKLIADVGIIGFPNAGKSSLLASLSGARPKIARFPFTTKAPVLGIAETEDFERFVIIEIPPLIEGSHRGKGIGNEFLRHLERVRLLIHIVDVSSPEAIEAYHFLREELFIYDEELRLKPEIIILNKIDLPGALDKVHSFKERLGKVDIFLISCKTKEGIAELKKRIIACVKRLSKGLSG